MRGHRLPPWKGPKASDDQQVLTEPQQRCREGTLTMILMQPGSGLHSPVLKDHEGSYGRCSAQHPALLPQPHNKDFASDG